MIGCTGLAKEMGGLSTSSDPLISLTRKNQTSQKWDWPLILWHYLRCDRKKWMKHWSRKCINHYFIQIASHMTLSGPEIYYTPIKLNILMSLSLGNEIYGFWNHEYSIESSQWNWFDWYESHYLWNNRSHKWWLCAEELYVGHLSFGAMSTIW